MRLAVAALAGAVLLAACSAAAPYLQEDLIDVTVDYAALRPVYVDFESAYTRNNIQQMSRDYDREQRLCGRVDAIDRRDSIDPNTNLFQASLVLDTLCNDIESAYAGWQKEHGRPYDKSLPPSTPADAFKNGDSSLKKMRKYLRHPSQLS